MKTICSVLSSIVILSTVAYAAQVYGNLKEGDRSVPQGVKVEITCAGSQRYPGETDRYGSYSVYVPRPGKCNFRVNYPVNSDRWAQGEIYSYDDPVRYDFDLIQQKDGSYELRRR